MDLISLKDFTRIDIEKIIDRSLKIKSDIKIHHRDLEFKSMAMLFQKNSTRTRVSFELAMRQLGGSAIFLDWGMSNFTISSIEDEIRYLMGNVDIIMARFLFNSDLIKITRYSSVPVINGCCEKFHPCQVISDLVSLKKYYKSLDDIHVVFTGVHNNVCNSWILAADKLGFYLTLAVAGEHDYALDRDVLVIIKENSRINYAKSLKEVVCGADVVYTDSWEDMNNFSADMTKKDYNLLLEKMYTFQVNKENLVGFHGFIMHDMPIHAGFEITRQMIESDKAIIFEQSHNRLYAQKAIILFLMGLI